MKKFLRKTTLFLLPLVVLALGAEYALRNIPNDYSYKASYLESNADKVQVLLFGSSHTYYGLNPAHFSLQPAFNASHISQSIDLDYALFQKYAEDFSELRVVVIPVDYFTLFATTSTGIENWRMKNYNIYYDIHSSYTLAENSELLSFQLDANAERIRSYYLGGRSEQSCSELGYGHLKRAQKDFTQSAEQAARIHTKADHVHFNANKQTLQDFIELADKRNVQVLLFTSPAHATYVSSLDEEQLGKSIKTATELGDQYENCVYHDLMEDRRFEDSDFRDADHLNQQGAKKLSSIIDSLSVSLLGRSHQSNRKVNAQ